MHSEDSDQTGHPPTAGYLSLRWAHMPICWFCHDAAQIIPELVLEMTQWKNFMSASAWVQVLDFTKSLVYVNSQNDRKCCFVLLFFFFFFCFLFFLFFFLLFFFRLCAVYAFYHICLFIISGEFDALHQLSVKKGSFGNTASKA